MYNCLSVGNKNFNSVLNIIPKYEMAEIRLDLCHFSYIQIEELFKSHKNLMATFRNSTEGGDAG
ncbi:MAG: type I 3-dehydroquinate dehydratase [Saprospiraceae bacterium]